MSSPAVAQGHDRAASAPDSHPSGVGRLAVGATIGAVVVAGVVLRFWATSDLWLDEALSVHIARLPLGDIPEALRQDGHPPLYYFMLHGWMVVFGEGDSAVRALSGILAVATLPLAWWTARRYNGRTTAALLLVLLASLPFAARYGTEARMYSLVILLVFAGWLLVDTSLRHPSPPVLAGIGVVTGALLLTHYWSFHLVAATVLVLGIRTLRHTAGPRRAGWRTLAAIGVGSLLFLPWLPSFLHQLEHTGTPWTEPTRPAAIVMDSLEALGGGPQGEARLLGWMLGGLAVLGVLAHRTEGWRVHLDFRSHAGARPEALVITTTLAVGAVAGFVTGTGYASRYFAVVLPLFLLLAALGTTRLPGRWIRHGVAGLLVVLGFTMSTHQALTQRTQGGDIARAVAGRGDAGDVVVFCPDQLGPAVDRVLPERFVERPFPEGTDAARVDWTDYETRNAAADPDGFARRVLAEAEGRGVWLVWRSGYRTFDGACGRLAAVLGNARRAERVTTPSDVFEPAELTHYPAR